MALELNTDGTTQAATTGDTVVNLVGNYNATVLGATFQWCAGFFGAYTAFTRIVTGVTIDIQTPISISIFGGFRLVVEGGAVFKVSKMKEMNEQNGLAKLIADLDEWITTRKQLIETSTNVISTLREVGTTRTIDYDINSTSGDTSTEEWNISKSITSGSYSLNCEESAMIVVGGAGIIQVLSTGVAISGPLIEFE